MWEMALAEVKDQSWAPVAVSPLAFEWRGPDADSLRKVERAVLAELRSAFAPLRFPHGETWITVEEK